MYTLCGVDKDGKSLCVLCYYNADHTLENKKLKLDFGKEGAQYQIYLVDQDHNGELIKQTDDLTLDVSVNSMLLIKEI